LFEREDMLLCKKIKIEVSKQDAATLEFMQGKCRGLYNWWVMKLRNGEYWPGWEQAKKTLQESRESDPEINAVYGKLLQEVFFRLDNAMQSFFRRVAEGEKKPGFPRVKPRHQFFTLCYPAMYLGKIEGNSIVLPTGGGRKWGPKHYPNIVAHLTEAPPARFREVAVSRDARGNYYCSFVYDDAGEGIKDEHKPHEKRKDRKTRAMRDEGIVAFDLGIKTLATGVNDQGRFYRIGGFKGYRWHNKQRDCLHKASHLIAGKLAERAVVIGDRALRQMVIPKKERETRKERNKRRIRNRIVYNDWGLYGFVQMLKYKCLRFGKELYIIDERDTTKMCHACKRLQDMPLWKRTYRCENENCGLVMDRDENSAVNIYERFVARLGPHR
jgi:putative transposase